MGFRERLATSSKNRSSRIVLALDVTGPRETRSERAVATLTQVAERVAAVKINFQLILPRGLEGISGVSAVCAEYGLPLIADIKLNDIESTNLDAVELLFSSGVDAVIANPFVGFDEGLSGVIRKARTLERGVILLVYMSHAGAREGFGMKVENEPLYLEFARRVREWEADGAVVSAKSLQSLAQVRKILGRDKVILSPGVGTQGGDAAKAVKAGADYPIVGRSVVDSPDPLKVVQELNRAIPPP